MKTLTCAAARRSLQAFHDSELPVSQQIAVWAHLEWCGECAARLAELQMVRAALVVATQGRGTLASEDAASFNATVVSRLKAERDASWFARLDVMFEDMHLVYAGVGAAVATVVCVIIMLSMMRFATSERPDSLAAIVTFLATPGSNQNPVPIDGRVLLPRALDAAFSAGGNETSAEVDAVFTLAAVVTREGRIANLELLHANGGPQLADQARLVEGLLNAVSRARFEPARMAGLPVAVNMVWLVARTTVRPNKTNAIVLPVVPVAKKRVASLTTGRSSLVMV
jgi:hypothetical protein